MERNHAEMQQKIQEVAPVFIEIFRLQPNVFGVIPGYNDSLLLFFLAFLGTLVIFAFTCIFIVHGLFVLQMRKIKKWVSAETFVMHQMLHRFVFILSLL